MLLGVFLAVIEAQKLEVCIHKQNYMVEKLSEYQFTNMSDATVSISIIICGIQLKVFEAKHSNLFELKLNYTCIKQISKLKYIVCHIREPFNFR